ncbi:MAG: hypothetical protein ACI82F_000096 [Planctomycetota bacterium]
MAGSESLCGRILGGDRHVGAGHHRWDPRYGPLDSLATAEGRPRCGRHGHWAGGAGLGRVGPGWGGGPTRFALPGCGHRDVHGLRHGGPKSVSRACASSSPDSYPDSSPGADHDRRLRGIIRFIRVRLLLQRAWGHVGKFSRPRAVSVVRVGDHLFTPAMVEGMIGFLLTWSAVFEV